MSVFEILMLVCFGAAWPASIRKSLKSRQTGGKSLMFLAIVDLGYVAGILHKLLYAQDFVIILYIINFCMVSFDLALWIRNRRLEKRAEEPNA